MGLNILLCRLPSLTTTGQEARLECLRVQQRLYRRCILQHLCACYMLTHVYLLLTSFQCGIFVAIIFGAAFFVRSPSCVHNSPG